MEVSEKDKEIDRSKEPQNSNTITPGSDGQIHPMKVYYEEKEMEGPKGKYKIKVTVCKF
jgi:hypothetical protein